MNFFDQVFASYCVLKRHSCSGKSRGKRRKGDPAAPPPLLLVQDPQAAQKRIQERVSSLLLLTRPPTPPTPTLLPSALSTHTFLWLKSALPGGGPASLSDFYTAELEAFIQPDIGMEVRHLHILSQLCLPQDPSLLRLSGVFTKHLEESIFQSHISDNLCFFHRRTHLSCQRQHQQNRVLQQPQNLLRLRNSFYMHPLAIVPPRRAWARPGHRP